MDTGAGIVDGTPTTANFLAGMMKSLPPLQDILNIGGMKLPDFLVKQQNEQSTKEVPKEIKKSESKTEKKKPEEKSD